MTCDGAMDALEAEFAAALLAAERPPPAGLRVPPGADVAHRFGIYRNNVVAGLVNALGERFPVAKRLVGDEFFAVMARTYVVENPPRSPLLFRYGDSFSGFIDRFEPAATVPFLADIARLEFLRGEAYHAADREPLAPSALKALSAAELPSVGLQLHPSARFMQSRHPVVSIWQAHQGGSHPMVREWQPQNALVVRRKLSVEVHLLPSGGYAFLSAIAHGGSITVAAKEADAVNSGFDSAAMFVLLVGAQAIIGLSSLG